MTDNPNPLSKYFRQPGIYIDLPSQLKWYSSDFIKTTANFEVAVYPMTGQDELIKNNPDALMNGEAVASIIKSCVPDVQDPKKLVSADVEALNLAIRVATYGDNLKINSSCPNCEDEKQTSVNVRTVLGEMEYIECVPEVELPNQLVVHLRPYDYEDLTKLQLATFQEQKLLQQISEDADEETKSNFLNESFRTLIKLNRELLINSITKVSLPDGTEVTNKDHIGEFVDKIEKKSLDKINQKISEMNDSGFHKPLTLTCDNSDCGHSWEVNVEYDEANFFE